ncbi:MULTISPECIES: hypothetical protein [Providencia]|nr:MULTISPECIES: hypothetical protein [Providencia]MCG5279714.1 hypothetical protein [Providencia rettgeri]MCG5292075.1 hypothetical protein [Providencia rettgeri]MCG5371232.1 hypothetical protein [Providencia rettgeri]MCG5379976.1 hypothetical protein [Providencia rettgeri]MCG9942014.1 hypothetical protein [Providencia rettgeri]
MLFANNYDLKFADGLQLIINGLEN